MVGCAGEREREREREKERAIARARERAVVSQFPARNRLWEVPLSRDLPVPLSRELQVPLSRELEGGTESAESRTLVKSDWVEASDDGHGTCVYMVNIWSNILRIYGIWTCIGHIYASDDGHGTCSDIILDI